MPQHRVTVRCAVPESFAVDQVRGMFDLARAAEASETFAVELPERGELVDGQSWRIGVIVGPSGSGKSTVARSAYGDDFCERFDWDPTKAVVDQFPGVDLRTVTDTLNAVGFSSPPAWVKPHHVLSGGERFRCDLARALLRGDPSAEADSPGSPGLVAFDEFTSVVDRTVAKICSAAIAKSLRRGRIGTQFVAVTCHYDVLDWLEPDWVLDMANCQLARGRLWRRPTIELEVAPVHRSAWSLFSRHHYLTHEIQNGAKCFVAFWPQPDGTSEPVGFSSWVHRMTRNGRAADMREHRTVVLPDFQGVGIGNRLSEVCASIWVGLGGRAFSTTSHPAMIGYRSRSDAWRTIRHGMVSAGSTKLLKRRASSGVASGIERSRLAQTQRGQPALTSAGRITGGFQYVGPAMAKKQAEDFVREYPHRQILRAFPLGAASVKVLARRSHHSAGCVSKVLGELVTDGLVERMRHGPTQIIYELTEAGRRDIGRAD